MPALRAERAPFRRERSDPEAAAPLWLICATLAAFAAFFLIDLHHNPSFVWFEDLPVYQAAVRAFMAGTDPYAALVPGLRFVYTPLVLFPLSWLAALMPGQSEWLLIGTLHVLCVLAAPFVLARFYFRQPWLTSPMSLLIWFAEPIFTGMRTLYSANLAPTLYLAALLAAVPGLRRNRWFLFYAVVLLAGTVKITLVILLLIPILAGKRQWIQSIATVAAVAALYLAQQRLLPDLFSGYKAALFQQFTVDKRYGYGIFGLAAAFDEHVRHNLNAAYALHLLFAATLVGLLLWLKYRGCDRFHEPGRPTTLWRGLIVIAIIFVNPRILHYDFYLALFAAFVVLAVTLRLAGWRLVAMVPVVFLPSLLVLPGIRPWFPGQVYQVCLILAALAAGIWQLWKETAPTPYLSAPGAVEPIVAPSFSAPTQ